MPYPIENKGLNTASVIIFFVFLSLLMQFFPGHEWDNLCWTNWCQHILHAGLPYAYGSENNYLPFYQYFLYAYSQLAGTDEAIRENIGYLRIASLAFDFLGLRIVYKWLNKKPDFVFILFISMANLSYFYNTAIWGQADGILATLVFASLYFAHTGKMVTSAFFFTLAVNMKLQAIVFLPLCGLMWLHIFIKDKDPKVLLKAVLAMILTELILITPFLYKKTAGDIWSTVVNSVDYYPRISMNAFNLWHWWVVVPSEALDSTILLAGLSYKQVGLLLFFTLSFFALLPLTLNLVKFARRKADWPSKELIWLSAALVCISFFWANTQMHERYSHPAFIFLTAYAFHTRRWLIYILFSLAYFLNLEKALMAFNLQNYDTLIFDPRFVSGIYVLIMMLLFIRLYRLKPLAQTEPVT